MEENMNEMMEELRQLFTELLAIVEKYGDSECKMPKRILKEILYDLEEDVSDTDKFSLVKRNYNSLFFPRSPLSEFYIWSDDYDERVKLNAPYKRIKDRLWELLKK